MQLKDRLNLYKENYYYQLDFKEKLYSRLNIVLVLIIACITGILSNFTFLQKLGPCLSIWMYIIYILTICCFISILFFFYKISHVKKDHLLPTPIDIESYRIQLIDHFNQYAIDPKEHELEEYLDIELQKFFVQNYAFATSENQINNEFRSLCINRIYFLTCMLSILVLLIGIMYASTHLYKGDNNESKYSTTTTTTNNKNN